MKKEKVQKPWGWYLTLDERDNRKVKYLYIKKGEELSLQRHKQREEIWLVLEGTPKVYLNSYDFRLVQGETIEIGIGEVHKAEADMNDVLILEVQTGNCIEEDIERLEDKYKR